MAGEETEGGRGTGGRALAAAGCVAAAALLVAAAVVWGPDLWAFFTDGDAVRAWVDAQGPLAPVAMGALVVAQIVVAVLPGEPVELAAGYLFGFWEGTAVCLAGGLVGTLSDENGLAAEPDADAEYAFELWQPETQKLGQSADDLDEVKVLEVTTYEGSPIVELEVSPIGLRLHITSRAAAESLRALAG